MGQWKPADTCSLSRQLCTAAASVWPTFLPLHSPMLCLHLTKDDLSKYDAGSSCCCGAVCRNMLFLPFAVTKEAEFGACYIIKAKAETGTGSWVMTLLLFHCSGVRTDCLSPRPPSSCADTSSDPSDLGAAVTIAATVTAPAAAASQGFSSKRKQDVFNSRTPVLLDPLKQELTHHTWQREERTKTHVVSVLRSNQRC